MLYVDVLHMAGAGYVEWSLHFFFLPTHYFWVERLRGYLRKTEGSLPIKSKLSS